jgi:CubicO group peptidase (beta-lactamase class C family)
MTRANNILHVCFCVLVLIFASCKKDDTSTASSLEYKVDSIIHATPDFSGVVLIGEEGKTIYHKAFGYRNWRTSALMDTTSIFELASVSKQFTAMIIMMLKEEGKLDYEDNIVKYIPGLPYHGITIRHLLNHTSGLPDYQAVMQNIGINQKWQIITITLPIS